MKMYNNVIDKLKELNINFEIVEHEPALTTEQADSYIEGIEGVRTKTLFLTNKKKTAFYLLIMDDSKRLDMNAFREIIGEKQIRMSSENSLFEKMKLTPGIVSPFGLFNNEEHDIDVYIDQAIINEERMSFHPNTNEKTVFIKTVDLLALIENLDYAVGVVTL